MSFITIAGLVIATWAMLSVVGSERQRELTACRRKVAEELEAAAEAAAAAAAAPPPPPQPPSAKTPPPKPAKVR
jgi:hypothetical protein